MIRTVLDAKVTMSNGEEKNQPIRVHMEYDEEDQLTYSVIFEEDETETFWTMGRDLFINAIHEGSAGSSDIILVDTGEYMGMTLIIEDTNAVILLPMPELQAFVNASTNLIPQGRESVDDQIEELLMEIFE